MRNSALRVLVLASALAAAVAVSAGSSAAAGQAGTSLEKLREMLREGEPAFTDAELQKAAQELIPPVEKAAGRRFRTPPKVAIADREAMGNVLTEELLPQLKKFAQGQSAQEVRESARQQAEAFSACLLGKYGLAGKTLYMLPRNFGPLMKLTKTDPKYTMAIVKLIAAHELAHAMQDQEVDLRKMLLSAADMEGMLAFNAVMEGQAVFVQDQVGKALKLDDAALEVARILSAGAVKLDDPALELINKMVATQFEQIYLSGRKFVEYHYGKGGMGRVWQILASPPADTSMIAHPDTYSPKRASRLDYARILAGLEDEFGQGKWQVANQQIGRMLLKSVYAGMEAKAQEKIIDNIAHVQTLIAQRPSPPAMGDVSLFVLKDPKLAGEMVATLEDLARKNVQKMKSSAMVTVSGFEVGRFAQAPADAAVASKVQFTVTAPGVVQQHVFVRIARGDVLVEIHGFGVGLTDAKIAAIAQKVFARHDQAKGLRPPAEAPPKPALKPAA